MRKFLTCSSVLVFFALATTSLRADTFTVVGYGNTYTFDLSADPVPSISLAGIDFDVTTYVSVNGAPGVSDLFTFYNGAFGGGFQDSDEFFGLLGIYSPQLYSGTEANPVFLLSDFLGTENAPNDFSIAVSPEPSSIALLATGMLGAFGAARRRFKA